MDFEQEPFYKKLAQTTVVVFTSIAAGYIVGTFHPKSFEWLNTFFGRFLILFLIIWSIIDFDFDVKRLIRVVIAAIIFSLILWGLQELSFKIYGSGTSAEERKQLEEQRKRIRRFI